MNLAWLKSTEYVVLLTQLKMSMCTFPRHPYHTVPFNKLIGDFFYVGLDGPITVPQKGASGSLGIGSLGTPRPLHLRTSSARSFGRKRLIAPTRVVKTDLRKNPRNALVICFCFGSWDGRPRSCSLLEWIIDPSFRI